MPNLTQSLKIISAVVILGVSMPVFAEAAPVFDADSLQMAENDQQGPDYLPPAPDAGYQQSAGNQIDIDQQPVHLTVDQRISRMEQQLNNMQNTDSGQRMDSLQDQVQSLRNQLEEMSHQLEQMQNQQRAVLAELARRTNQPIAQAKPVAQAVPQPDPGIAAAAADAAASANINPVVANSASRAVRKAANVAVSKAAPGPSIASTTASVVAAPSADAGPSQPNVAEEQQIYQTAYNLIKAKKYNDAVKALQSMLNKYPSGQFASNAHYWLGELYGLMGKNDQALTEFSNVVKTYPDSPRVSDAQLKIGLLLAAQFKWADAKSAFKEVINRYPGTASSRLAAEQIKQIKQAGH